MQFDGKDPKGVDITFSLLSRRLRLHRQIERRQLLQRRP